MNNFLLNLVLIWTVFHRLASGNNVWLNARATIGPSSSVYRRPGESLKLVCAANFSPNRTVENLFFSHRTKDGRKETEPLASESVNGSAIQLVVGNLTWDDAGRYTCKLNATTDEGVRVKNLCSSRLHVGLDPLPPKDFRCISKGLETLSCSWSIPDGVIEDAAYHVGYKLFNGPNEEYYGCDSVRCDECSGRRFNCTFKAENYNQVSERFFFFNEADNPLNGSNVQFPVLEFNNFRNVRPFAPENLILNRIGQRNATVSWDIRKALIPLASKSRLVHELSWKSRDDTEYKVELLNTTKDNFLGRTVNHTLTGLPRPCTEYTVRVRTICSQPEFPDLWSNYSEEFAFPGIPSEVPSIPPGAFYYDDGTVTIFWERVPASLCNGPNFAYVVDYFDGGVRNRIETGGETFSARLIGTRSDHDGQLNFSVSSKNDAGTLQGPVINVAPWHGGELHVEATSVGDGVHKVTWNPTNLHWKVEFYTIFYCEEKPYPHHQRCLTQPKRMKVDRSTVGKMIELTEGKHYSFAVIVHSSAGVSPLFWANRDSVKVDKLEQGVTLYLGLAVVGALICLFLAAVWYPARACARAKIRKMKKVEILMPRMLTTNDDGVMDQSPEKRPRL